jgi:hypothetical protein
MIQQTSTYKHYDAFKNVSSRSLPSTSQLLTTNIPYIPGRIPRGDPPLCQYCSLDRPCSDSGYADSGLCDSTGHACYVQRTVHEANLPCARARPQCQQPSSGTIAQSLILSFVTERLALFKPQRWVRRDAEGIEVFKPQSLTRLAFSLGLRGCFDKSTSFFTAPFH